jgi:hypothetical protein
MKRLNKQTINKTIKKEPFSGSFFDFLKITPGGVLCFLTLFSKEYKI